MECTAAQSMPGTRMTMGTAVCRIQCAVRSIRYTKHPAVVVTRMTMGTAVKCTVYNVQFMVYSALCSGGD